MREASEIAFISKDERKDFATNLMIDEGEGEMGTRRMAGLFGKDEGVDLETDFEGGGEEGWWW